MNIQMVNGVIVPADGPGADDAEQCLSVSPLVELTDLAARHGWRVLAGEQPGEVRWVRGANQIVAQFARASQRPLHCALLNYTAASGAEESPQLGPVVFRGVGNGGGSAEALASLRRWLVHRERSACDATQW